MSAIVGRVIHERRERAKRAGRRRPPQPIAQTNGDKTAGTALPPASDSNAVEAAVTAAVALQVDERLALRRGGSGCFLPCLKGAWLCNALGLVLIALGSVMCFFAFHSDTYSRFAFSSPASAEAAASSFYESAPSAAAAATEVVATTANDQPVSAAVAARSASMPDELAIGDSWILRSFLKSLSYLGPTVIGVGAFIIVVSCVTILDRRELIVTALKSREAQLSKRNKDTVYAAVVARYMRRRQMGDGEHRPRSRADDASSPAATDRPYAFIASAIRQLHDCGDAIALRGALVADGLGRRHSSSSCSGASTVISTRGAGTPPNVDGDCPSMSAAEAIEPTEPPLDALWQATFVNAAAPAGVGCTTAGSEARDNAMGLTVERNRFSLPMPAQPPLWENHAASAGRVSLSDSFGPQMLACLSGPPAYSAVVVTTCYNSQPRQDDLLTPERRRSLGIYGGGTQHVTPIASV